MATSRRRTDPAPLQRILPGLSRVVACDWVVSDDSDDGFPGLVSTWLDAVVQVDDELAAFLAGYTPEPRSAPPRIDPSLGRLGPQSGSWRSGPVLPAALGATSWTVDAAVQGAWVVLRASRGG